MSLALRPRLTRLEKVGGEPVFAGWQPEHLRELAGLVGAVLGRDLAGVAAAALPRAPDRTIKDASNAELERLPAAVRAAIDPQLV